LNKSLFYKYLKQVYLHANLRLVSDYLSLLRLNTEHFCNSLMAVQNLRKKCRRNWSRCAILIIYVISSITCDVMTRELISLKPIIKR